ncbi:MAG: hypothetical protein WD598_14760 [Acidimicrobiia bacterium]
MGGDDIEIDLTAADRADGLLPIRWVRPGATGSNGNSPSNGNGNGHANGDRNGDADPHLRVTAVAPRVVTLAAFSPLAPPMPVPDADAPVITVLDADEWWDVPEPVTLRRVMASRGARVLTVVVVAVFTALLAATVLLWQRVEEARVPPEPVLPKVETVTPDQLLAVENRLNSIETKLASMVDAAGTMVTAAPTELQSELVALRSCLSAFQRAIDDGSVRGGRFAYCG